MAGCFFLYIRLMIKLTSGIKGKIKKLIHPLKKERILTRIKVKGVTSALVL